MVATQLKTTFLIAGAEATVIFGRDLV